MLPLMLYTKLPCSCFPNSCTSDCNIWPVSAIDKIFPFYSVHVTAFWSLGLANDNWETVTCPLCLKANHNSSSSSNSASVTHNSHPFMQDGCSVVLFQFWLSPFHSWSVQDIDRYWEYLKQNTLSAALPEAPDNWQTGQRKGAEETHHSLTAWILIGLYI